MCFKTYWFIFIVYSSLKSFFFFFKWDWFCQLVFVIHGTIKNIISRLRIPLVRYLLRYLYTVYEVDIWIFQDFFPLIVVHVFYSFFFFTNLKVYNTVNIRNCYGENGFPRLMLAFYFCWCYLMRYKKFVFWAKMVKVSLNTLYTKLIKLNL